MINRWERGRAQIDQLIQQGRLTRVAANRDLAEGHLAQAGTHLTAAATVRDLDPAGAFTLTYDAARLALAALLVNQGLKPRGEGAHAVLLEAAIAQLSHHVRLKSANSTGCVVSATIPSTPTLTAPRRTSTTWTKRFLRRGRLWIGRRD
jgi:hypothetical protein